MHTAHEAPPRRSCSRCSSDAPTAGPACWRAGLASTRRAARERRSMARSAARQPSPPSRRRPTAAPSAAAAAAAAPAEFRRKGTRRKGYGPAVWARRWWAGPCSTGGTTTAAAARRIHGRPHPARVGAALRCMTEAALLDAAPYGTRFALLLLALAPGLARARALRPRRAGPSPPLPQGPARTQLVGHVARHTSVSLPGLALPGAASCDQGQSIGAECLFADYRLRVMVSACRQLQVSELVAAEERQASAGHSVRLSVGLPAPGRVARSRDKGLALCASAGEL